MSGCQDLADVLVEQGRSEEAFPLFEQALLTTQGLGDIHEIAVIETKFAPLLFLQEDYERALPMAWHAYKSLCERDYATQAQQQILVFLKESFAATESFSVLWEQTIHEPQPDWLYMAQAGSNVQEGRIPTQQLDTIVSSTIAFMRDVKERRAIWRNSVKDLLQQAQDLKRPQAEAFFAAILAVLDDEEPSLSQDNPYAEEFAEILAGIAASKQFEHGFVEVSDEVVKVVEDFINAEDIDSTRRVVEAQHALLFQPEVEVLFEQHIAQSREVGNQEVVRVLEQHLALLRACKAIGIAEASNESELHRTIHSLLMLS